MKEKKKQQNKTSRQTEPEWCCSQSASDVALVPFQTKQKQNKSKKPNKKKK